MNTFLEMCVSSLCREHANLHCIPSEEEKLDCTAGLLREIRTFGRDVEPSVSPLTNALGGLSGGGRGGDTSGAAAAPSFVECPGTYPALSLCLGRRRLLASLLHEESACCSGGQPYAD